MKTTKPNKNDFNLDRDSTAISIIMVSKIIRELSDGLLTRVGEKAALRIADPEINRLLNQLLYNSINDLPLQIFDMAIEQHGNSIRDDILEVIGEPINPETKDHVLKTISLAKDKARTKWVHLPTTNEYKKF